MKDQDKTQEQLTNELVEGRQRIAELEAADTKRVRAEEAIQHRRIWLPVAGMFVLLCILAWLDEVMDLPRLLLGAPQSSINWREAIIETVLITSVGLLAVLRLIHSITERVRAEEELRKYRDHLEELVDERTAELTRANEQLRQEVIERKRVEERLDHLNAVLRAIRNVNQLITRERDRDRLLQGACENLIETRGYHNAWIALLDKSGGLVTTAEAGLGEEFLPLVERLERGELTACGRRALAQVGAVVTEDPPSACADCPLAANYAGRGAMTVRLEHGDKVYGLASVSIPTHLLADEEEQALFEEVAADIAFALRSIELEEERVRAEAALREERDKAQRYLDVAGVMFVVIDADQNVSLINRRGCDILGREEEEIVGKNWFDTCIPERLRDEVKAVFDKLMDGEVEPVKYYENPIVTKGGEERIIAWHNTLLTDGIGNAIGTLSSGEDITERKRAEEALRESEEKFRSLIENSLDGITVLNADGTVRYESKALERMLGYKQEERVGKSSFELLHPDDVQRAKKLLAQLISNPGSTIRGEATYKHKDGSWRTLEMIGSNLIYNPAVNGIVVNSRDITERKRAEEALRVSEERFALAVRGSDAGLWDWDIQNNSLYWSPRLKELLGYADGELDVDFDTFESLLHPDDREHTGAAIEAHLRDQGLYDVEQRLRTKSGEYRWFRARGQALWDEAGNPLRMIGFTTDITERKQTEEALKEYSERLEEMVEERTKELRDAQEQLVRREKLAILGQLAGGVGHELRNPLGVISNAVYFLQMTLPDADETTRESLEMISEEVRNSTKIISDLLDFSRTRLPEREEVAVSELVAEVLEKLPPPENVEVTTEIAPDLPPVYVDPRQIGQVLGNLVVNAYQAMPEGGVLTIKTARLSSPKTSEVSEKLPKSKWVALSVSDTGCGISQENLAKIFEPLFTTRARGIGLGLATSRILVEANGGSMEVESEVGRGSTFTVRLPTREVVA